MQARPQLQPESVTPNGAVSVGMLRDMVALARGRALHRHAYRSTSETGHLTDLELNLLPSPDPRGREYLDDAVSHGRISTRTASTILRLSWTLADLGGHERPTLDDIREAAMLREGTPAPHAGDTQQVLQLSPAVIDAATTQFSRTVTSSDHSRTTSQGRYSQAIP
jgi:magnesium chelatase family protein